MENQCEYCQNFKPLIETETSTLFISSGRLILQDKTKGKDSNGCLPSTWIEIDSCPICNARFVKDELNKNQILNGVIK